MGKRALKTEEELKAEVDGLLGEFGVLGEADPSFEDDDAAPKMKNGERHEPLAKSADADALWGGSSSKKK
ncbi:MAG: hypothetical protein JNM17_24745 [Archangium sp.]|nr:hypothetical protein [Archangium sp.]